MLTKDEANLLFNDIYNEQCVFALTLRASLKRFTVVPKREIQIGDIYRDRDNRLREICRTELECGFVYANGVMAAFDLDGHAQDMESNWDLDLTKRYELVEVEDE